MTTATDLLSDELHLGERWKREHVQAEIRQVEVRVADHEEEILPDAHLDLGGAGIRLRGERQVDNRAARRDVMGLVLEERIGERDERRLPCVVHDLPAAPAELTDRAVFL